MNDLARLEAALQRLQDLEEIRALKYKYAYGANVIDGEPGDLKAFGELFAEDGTFDVALGAMTGPVEIESLMRDLTARWQCAMHYMLNPLVTLDRDRAQATTTGLFAFTTKQNPRPIWMSMIYNDTFVRTPQGWRFQSVSGRMTIAEPAYFELYADHITVEPAA